MAANRLAFVSLVDGEAAQRDCLLLAASIRKFAGSLSGSPIRFYVPEGVKLPHRTQVKLAQLKIEVAFINIPESISGFVLASFPYAAAHAEGHADSETLVWLASETMMLREPSELVLPMGKSLGVRPVHHLLVSSPWEKPVDAFWEAVYRHCGVNEADLYPMQTVADGVRIRPYYNAGLLAVRPEDGVMKAWRDSFLSAYRQPSFEKFYAADPRYKVFMHQAILAGVALKRLGRKKIQELPASYNYPLHLYRQDATPGKPKALEALTTFRFESTFRESGWRSWIPAGEALKDWIEGELA